MGVSPPKRSSMKSFLGVGLALVCAGCGTWFVQADLDARARGTVAVRGRGATARVGSLEIVEQAPGQGFVMEGGVRTAVAALEGFGAPLGGRAIVQTSGSYASFVQGGDASVRAGSRASGVLGAGDASGQSRSGADAIGSQRSGGVVEVASNGGAISSEAGGDGGAITSHGGVNDATVIAAGSQSTADGSSLARQANGGTSEGGASLYTASNEGIDVALEGSVELEARASVARTGVWSRDGRATAITALSGDGVQVDGVMVSLAELEALARVNVTAAPEARFATDGAIEAWAELEHETLPRAGGETHVVVRVRAPQAPSRPRERVRVHLVIDRSSSMQRDWPRVIYAARALVRALSADDEIHIVAYGSDAFEAFSTARVGDGRAAIAALDRISVGGGTNIEAGLDLAYRATGSGPRSLVILLSDGVPNAGAFEASELGGLAASARLRGCTTSVVGLGTEFDARVLGAIAREGNGGYHVAASLDTLGAGLVSELEAHARAAATQLRVRIALPSDVSLLGIADGDVEREGDAIVLSVPHFDAGSERRIVLRVRAPASARARTIAHVELGYRSQGGRLVSAARELDVSYGPRAVPSSLAAGIGIADASFALAIEAAGDAIADDNSAAATRALEDYATLVEGRVEHAHSEPLRARARVVHRLAAAVGALLPGATHPQRRQASLAFGALAARIGR
jgi:hypothetical protein